MFSSLLRPKQNNRSRRVDRFHDRQSPSPGPAYRHYVGEPPRRATGDFTEAEDDDEEEEDEDEEDDGLGQSGDDHDNVDDEDRIQRSLPVLPLFSETYLADRKSTDSLPIYSITHAIRIIVQTRTETTLSWDQIRSPQVSQFLVKPMQQQIRTQQFNRATLYCLMANCLQFNKEAQMYPGNAGNSSTRALVCELLALKLLKEYNTRELIDALSYDFYPLQGLPGAQPANAPKSDPRTKARLTAARTSTLEVAIRASAKHFLAHPLVVQQLEAIWNGAISFYSSADSLHREPPSSPGGQGKPDSRTPLLGGNSQKEGQQSSVPGRRSVVLYDPRQASLFKLSRLRVPRYRFFLSTLSLLVLIGLFLAVLAQRAARISSLELIFWFWSAGFMLDELVGFNEQGFSLYIMSFWNAFDLGILLLLIVYYFMRVYGVFLVDAKHWNDSAYDVLAANAILLLPRIFSVLDHYQYFSQLLIAFRLMAVDLVAVTVLILISCSGFFVFFTLADGNNNAADIAFRIFQLLMGFTPAAWELWPGYNWLERGLMGFFLIMCHFVIVTILITVLTNSFMKIASNAKEEHQFLFAINTISMVKNDALFSYVAPGNIFAWLLMPLRYCMPLKHFVKLNRTIIKVTHFPLLFFIFLYEKYWLAPSMYEPTDLVENHHHHGRDRTISFADPASRSALFSPNVRVREESITGYQKDHALEEVFRRGPGLATLRNQRRNERKKTQHAVRNWMDRNDEEEPSPHLQLSQWPTLENGSTSARPDWHRRLSLSRELRTQRSRQISDVRSAASDPAEFVSQPAIGSFFRNVVAAAKAKEEENQQTDADGDDELVTNDEEEEEDIATNAGDSRRGPVIHQTSIDDYFNTTPRTKGFVPPPASSSLGSSGRPSVSVTPRSARRMPHSRTMSTNTILYAPQELRRPPSSSSHSSPEPPPTRARVQNGRPTVVEPATAGGHRSPRRQTYVTNTRPRPIMPPRDAVQTAPNRAALTGIDQRLQRPNPLRRLSSVDMSILSENIVPDDPTGGMPSSFQTQMAMAMMKDARLGGAGRGQDAGDSNRMSKLVLARMKTLEESFADVARELRGLKTTSNSTAPTTRRNSSGEELQKVAGLTSPEIARQKEGGGDRPKMVRRTTGKRPASRKSNLGPLDKPKGKGKEPAHSSGDESDSEGPGMGPTKRSSM
ncbi:integral membrane channel protein [Colletotrichum cuscutae]|uniref:Integral membrane channel protein n=1 Tax=Colletotrichum cuscutae TaxID=1209917 RepID=A0AAI9UVS3_9PEZI|nr:integral membrane channel protein [Colletotrichum cuscutae]